MIQQAWKLPSKYANAPCSMMQPSLQSFFFSLPYAMISSLNGTEMNVCIVSVYMEPANERCRSCLYTGRRDARACSEQTSGHNRPGHCAIGRLFATAIRSRRVTMDSDRIRMKSDPCHLLPHFNPDTNANVDLIGSGYKTDSLNPDIFSI